MPFVLRKIRKAKWYKNENVPWLAEGELQADALSDLATQGNALSVWMIEDDLSNLRRIIAALVANQTLVSNVDYALLSPQLLLDEQFKFEAVAGDTPDEGANNWHRDIVELTASRLLRLATLIQQTAQIERLSDKEVIRFLSESVAQGFVDRTRLKPGVLAKLK